MFLQKVKSSLILYLSFGLITSECSEEHVLTCDRALFVIIKIKSGICHLTFLLLFLLLLQYSLWANGGALVMFFWPLGKTTDRGLQEKHCVCEYVCVCVIVDVCLNIYNCTNVCTDPYCSCICVTWFGYSVAQHGGWVLHSKWKGSVILVCK